MLSITAEFRGRVQGAGWCLAYGVSAPFELNPGSQILLYEPLQHQYARLISLSLHIYGYPEVCVSAQYCIPGLLRRMCCCHDAEAVKGRYGEGVHLGILGLLNLNWR